MQRRRTKVELFEQIRREYELGGVKIRALARKFGVHRRVVRQALDSALPPARQLPHRACPKLAPVKEFIDAILEGDRKNPRKQRHTAHRIYIRIGQELRGCEISERTVRQYVCEQKYRLGLSTGEIFIPQAYQWG